LTGFRGKRERERKKAEACQRGKEKNETPFIVST